MKKLILTQLMLALVAAAFLSSCGSDDDGPQILLPKLDGFYVFGENTAAESPSDPHSRMALAKLDNTKGLELDSKDDVFGKFMYIGAGAKIQFAKVLNEEGVFYGSDDATVSNGADEGFSVNDNVIHGTLVEKGAEITVAEEGLYYVFADMTSFKVVITKVKANFIGDAMVPNGWDSGTVLPQKSISEDKVVFEATNVQMTFGLGYKVRFNDGWHSYTDADISTHSFLGCLDYDAAWVAQKVDIGFFYHNIPSFAKGYYTVTLTYTESATGGEGVWTQNLVKTGEVITDYSNKDVGFFGNAFYISAGVEGAWADQGGVHKPVKNGNVFTWTWNDYELIADREFVIRENGTWAGIQGVYNAGTTRAGNAFDTKVTKVDNPESANFFVKVGGVYDITFKIDGVTNAQTLTINTN
jgi:hypothetical protein